MATEGPTVASPNRRTDNSELILNIVSFDMGRAPMKDLACERSPYLVPLGNATRSGFSESDRLAKSNRPNGFAASVTPPN
jgi:hypothetical protein